MTSRPATPSALAAGSPTPSSTSRDGLADPHVWAAHIAQAILDTLYGTRPAHQLARWTDPGVYNSIVSATTTQARTPGALRPAVRSIRIGMPTAYAAETSVLVQIGSRYRAAAMRLESAGGRWLCTAFELI